MNLMVDSSSSYSIFTIKYNQVYETIDISYGESNKKYWIPRISDSSYFTP